MSNSVAVISASRAMTLAKQAACIAVTAASLSLVSLSASAQLPAPQQTVEFGDLDLTNDQDTQRLYRRLRTAASEVCSQFNDASRRAVMRMRRQACETRALENAVATIGHPALTALHTAKAETKLAQSKSKSQQNS
jgi:UrcA family protein